MPLPIEDYAVIGDMHEIVPALNEEIRRRRNDSDSRRT